MDGAGRAKWLKKPLLHGAIVDAPKRCIFDFAQSSCMAK